MLASLDSGCSRCMRQKFANNLVYSSFQSLCSPRISHRSRHARKQTHLSPTDKSCVLQQRKFVGRPGIQEALQASAPCGKEKTKDSPVPRYSEPRACAPLTDTPPPYFIAVWLSHGDGEVVVRKRDPPGVRVLRPSGWRESSSRRMLAMSYESTCLDVVKLGNARPTREVCADNILQCRLDDQ